MKRATPVFNLIFSICIIITVLGCGPKIKTFLASPQRICKGEQVTVSWETNRKASITSEPQLEGTGKISKLGTKTFVLTDTTLFTLFINDETFAKQEIVVIDEEKEQMFVFRTEPLGLDSLIAIKTIIPGIWDNHIHIDSMKLASIQGDAGLRPLKVIHNNKMDILLADGSYSDTMSGEKISGRWEIRAPLINGEIMGDPTHPPPDRLRISVLISCNL